jgi:hypothetical protein
VYRIASCVLINYVMCLTCRYECRIYPGADGGITLYTIDVTLRKKSEVRLALLAQIGRLLSASVDSHLPSLLTAALKLIAG